jgi:hypothetical protein
MLDQLFLRVTIALKLNQLGGENEKDSIWGRVATTAIPAQSNLLGNVYVAIFRDKRHREA